MLKISISPFVGIEIDTASRFCSFGLLEGAGALIAGLVGTAGTAAAAGTAATVGTGLAGAIGSDVLAAGIVDAGIGAGLGAGEAAITGGDPGTGALLGGLTGGAVGGFGGLAGDALGIGATAGDALVGAGAGAVGAGITGGNPLTGAAEGGVSGAISGSIGGGGDTPTGAAAGGTTAPGASAPALAAPAGTPLTDLTAGIDPAGGGGGISLPGGSTPVTAGVDTSAITGPSPSAAGGGALPSVGAAGGGTSGITGPSGLSVQPITAPAADLSGIPSIGGGAGNTPSTIDTAIDNPTSGNILKALGANAGPLVAGAGLLTNLAGNQTLPGQNEIGQLAGGLQTQGQQLSSYLQNGTLPPGAQAGIDQATKAAQAATRSKYAAAGMSGSSAETQDLNNITEQAQAQQFQEANSLLQDGLNATSISGQLYAEMMNFDQQQSAQTGAAIASLAGALSGGGTVIKLGG